MTFGVVIELGTGALLLYGIPFIIVVGWFSSRILGVHRGWGRSFVAGFFGWSSASHGRGHRGPNIRTTHQLDDVILLAFLFGMLVSMLVGLILDILLKPHTASGTASAGCCTRSRRSSASSHRSAAPSRSSLRRASAGSGLQYASSSKLATPEFARRLRLTLEDCGGMFVKFGQIASTRSDLLPEVHHDRTGSLLQSSARPIDADAVREVIESRSWARPSRRSSPRSTSSRSRQRRSARRIAPCSRPASTWW